MKMAGAWKLLFICFCVNIVAVSMFHGEDSSSGGLCSNENEAQSYIAELMSKCFNVDLPRFFASWKLCGDEDNLTCTKLKKYVSAIPSCALCDYLEGDRRAQCYRDQLKQADCSINNMVIPTVTKAVTCIKDRGQCMPQQPSVSLDKMTHPAATRGPCPTLPTATNDPLDPAKPTTEKQVSVIAEAHYGGRCKKCDPCKECEVCKSCDGDVEAARMSAGVGVGLFFLGLILGTLVSCCVCLCAPSLHRRSSSLVQQKVLRRCNCCGTSDTQTVQTQNSHNHANSPPPETRGLAATQPSPDTYHDLNRQSSAGDSHTYVGLQHETTEHDATYIDPYVSDTYDAPQDRITPTAPPVHSPTYQVPDDNIIPGSHGSRPWPHRGNQNGNNNNYDNQEQGTDTNRRSNQYNVLMHERDNRTSNEYNTLTHDVGGEKGVGQTVRPGSDLADHQYFVLEAQAGDGSGSRSTSGQGQSQSQSADDNNYLADHNYFMLEKQNQ